MKIKDTEEIQCDLCQARSSSSIEAHKLEWDWITGYRKETFHVCLECQRKHPEAVAHVFKMAVTRQL